MWIMPLTGAGRGGQGSGGVRRPALINFRPGGAAAYFTKRRKSLSVMINCVWQSTHDLIDLPCLVKYAHAP